MKKSIQECINILKDGGTTINHEEKDSFVRVKRNECSTYIKKEQVIIKGECSNPNHSSRNALISVYDALSGKLKGIIISIIYFQLMNIN